MPSEGSGLLPCAFLCLHGQGVRALWLPSARRADAGGLRATVMATRHRAGTAQGPGWETPCMRTDSGSPLISAEEVCESDGPNKGVKVTARTGVFKRSFPETDTTHLAGRSVWQASQGQLSPSLQPRQH